MAIGPRRRIRPRCGSGATGTGIAGEAGVGCRAIGGDWLGRYSALRCPRRVQRRNCVLAKYSKSPIPSAERGRRRRSTASLPSKFSPAKTDPGDQPWVSLHFKTEVRHAAAAKFLDELDGAPFVIVRAKLVRAAEIHCHSVRYRNRHG